MDNELLLFDRIEKIKQIINKSGRKLLHVYLATGCINMGDGSGCIRYQRDVTELVESGEIRLKKIEKD